MDPTTALPSHMVEQVRSFADGTRAPAESRDAASVVLLRAGADRRPGSLEVYLLRRHVDMAFAAGMAVFPGGGVDPRDFDATIGWVGPAPEEWARWLGADDALARALVCAAVRETFEESGVLLAGSSAATTLVDTSSEDWEKDRRRLEQREVSLSALLTERDLALRSDLLRPWALWLTPEFEPRRYRTWLFLAELPSGQSTRDVSSESDEVTWLSVADALWAVHEDRMLMLPPQYCTCLDLFDFPDAAAALASADNRVVELIAPTGEVRGDTAYLVISPRWEQQGARVRAALCRRGQDTAT